MTNILTYAENAALRDMVDKYHSQSHVTIPLRDKIPFHSNWQKLTIDKVDRRTFKGHSSFGFQIPSNIVVIDVDNHGTTQKGNESLEKLCADFDFDFKTEAGMVVKTAGNGYHLYYLLPPMEEGVKPVNALNKYPAIEFKSKGRQVVIPESTLSNGKRYDLIKGSLNELTELPQALFEAIKTTNVINKEPKIAITKQKLPDAPADVLAFDNYLAKQPESIPGDFNGHKYRISAQAKNYGISPAVLLPKLMDWDTRVNFDPMTEDEVKTIILNAYNYSNEGASSKSITKVFNKVIDKTIEDSIEKGIVEKLVEAKEYKLEEIELWTDTLIKTKKGELSKGHFGIRNTEIHLQNLPEFKQKLALNLFTMDTVWLTVPEWRKKINEQILEQEVVNPEDADKIEAQPPLTDDDIVIIRGLLNNIGFDPNANQIHEAVRAVALQNMFHPVKDYFESLPKWDGVKRLDTFFQKYAGTIQNDYFAEVGRKIFVAVVTRVYIPGAKFDYTPVLVGGQGKAKSSFIKAMAIRPQWFSDSLGDIENKDVILQMRSKLIIENAEMAMTSKKAVTIQKAFLSRSTDRARLPYERLPRDIPRQCIFIATTNEDRFLIDETGNRRFWPIEIINLSIEKVRKDIDLLYAEALYLFKKGEMLFLSPETEKLAEIYQAERFSADEWQDKVIDWLEKEKPSMVKGAEIWTRCLGRMDLMQFDLKAQKRIANILRSLNWHATIRRIDGKQTRGFEKQIKEI